MDADIGQRVRASIEALEPPRSHRDIAQAVMMKPDAFSRSLNGERAFSSIEITRLADELGRDLHWLITGEEDPMRPRVAARHFFDQEARSHHVPGRELDEAVLADIALAYRQAYPDETVRTLTKLPSSVAEIRGQLGPNFVRPFIDRVETCLSVDVVRISEISTSYTLCMGPHTAIVIPASGSWFYENWSIAHELGHIAAGDVDVNLPVAKRYEHETRANAFAAELLLPASDIKRVNWRTITETELAHRIWDYGVSVVALQNRLATLRVGVSELISTWASKGTPSLLRIAGRNLDGSNEVEHAIAQRTRGASERRFPLSLQEAHMKRIALGELGKDTLAWMLGVDPNLLEEVETPNESHTVDPDELAKLLEL
ncbi:ImmA/IrrE family metallo-endopeptidase [Mycobacterium colombiense]|uniref:ImmA/IrrE family metallo-endopeptidase n=1 Tax=Mycobacterium colombiense TaxID=339268 RepID=UPI00097A9C73|nr:ImmA/IrrE family metallo-endopeptidase [Mycobacterium colombiense]OMC26415.1 hypothetical protein A5738_02875 [Mycobacterium colombiense]